MCIAIQQMGRNESISVFVEWLHTTFINVFGFMLSAIQSSCTTRRPDAEFGQ